MTIFLSFVKRKQFTALPLGNIHGVYIFQLLRLRIGTKLMRRVAGRIKEALM